MYLPKYNGFDKYIKEVKDIFESFTISSKKRKEKRE